MRAPLFPQLEQLGRSTVSPILEVSLKTTLTSSPSPVPTLNYLCAFSSRLSNRFTDRIKQELMVAASVPLHLVIEHAGVNSFVSYLFIVRDDLRV